MPSSENLVTFQSKAHDPGAFLVTRLDGADRMSRLYAYELEIVSKNTGVDFDNVLGNDATIGIKQGIKLAGSDKLGTRTIAINGLVSRISQLEERNEWGVYRVQVVPRMWKLVNNFCSQVYLDLDVPGIVAENLKAIGLSEGTDFEFRLSGTYPEREYVVQYEETDFDFVCRWLEHEGIFWFFEQGEDGEKVVFADDTATYKAVVGATTLDYQPQQSADAGSQGLEADGNDGSDWFAEETVSVLRCDHLQVPRDVWLKDYNWRNPTDPLETNAEVRDAGVGRMWEYNDHYKNEEEGRLLAAVRAGEILTRQQVFTGRSDCRSLQPGTTFELTSHYRSSFNAEYLITGVEHHATQSVSLASAATVSASYHNTFSAIPADRLYRPERVTDWPCIKGVMHGKVESSGDGKYAEINDDGSYRVRMPFDVAGDDKVAGKASRWVRMAQPYSGKRFGMHMPLLAGSEVILTHIDGDPDRPIIAGTVPNPVFRSPVTHGNQAKNVIRSASGNLIEMDDTEGQEGLVLMNGNGANVLAFRATAAGGPGGAGGVYGPNSHQPGLPALDGSVDAMSGGFTGPSFNSRVGIFTGPAGAFSPDGSALLPPLLWGDADNESGGGGEDQTTGEAETAYFTGRTDKQAAFHVAMNKVGPGAQVGCGGDKAGDGAGMRAKAKGFHGQTDPYHFTLGDEVDVHFGFDGAYHEGNTVEYQKGDRADSYMEVEEIYDSTEADKVAESVAAERIYSYVDTFRDSPKSLDVGSLASGEIREITTCALQTEAVQIAGVHTISEVAGAGIVSNVAAGTINEQTIAAIIGENVMAGAIASNTVAVGIIENVSVGVLVELLGTAGLVGVRTAPGTIEVDTIGLRTSCLIGGALDIVIGGVVEFFGGLNRVAIFAGVVDIDAKLAALDLQLFAGLQLVMTLAGMMEINVFGKITLDLAWEQPVSLNKIEVGGTTFKVGAMKKDGDALIMQGA